MRQPLAAGTLLDAALLLKMFPPRGGDRYAFWNIEVSTFRLLFPPSVLGSERDDNGWGFSPTIGLTLMGR